MAEGFLNDFYGDKYEAHSAGLEPTRVNPLAIEVMAEVGIDISKHRSKSIEELRRESFEYVVTVCDHAKEACPFFPEGRFFIHKGFADPSTFIGTKDENLRKIRRVRDQISDWIRKKFG
jgi:arsenate reductase